MQGEGDSDPNPNPNPSRNPNPNQGPNPNPNPNLLCPQVNILLSDLLQAAAGTLFLLMMVLSPLQLNDDEDEQFCDPSNHGKCITCLFFLCVIDV
jgi:hypothetical protein